MPVSTLAPRDSSPRPVRPDAGAPPSRRARVRGAVSARTFCDRHWAFAVGLVDLGALLAASLAAGLVMGAAIEPLVLMPCMTMAALLARGAYRHRPFRSSALDDIRALLANTAVGAMLTAALLRVTGHPTIDFPLIHLWSFAVMATALGRVALTRVQAGLRRRASGLEPVIIAGAGVVGHRVAGRLREHPEYGLDPIGFVDGDGAPHWTDQDALPMLGALSDLPKIAHEVGARRVLLAFSATPDRKLLGVIRRCQIVGLDVSHIPRFFEWTSDRATLEHLGELPVVRMRRPDPKGAEFAIKHAADRVIAATALLVLAPFLCAITLAVRLSSPGPVFFRQRRIGRDGAEFDLLKFRSMRADADQPADFELAGGSAPGGVEGVDRRTPIGRLLRRSSLDELPQLFNVLRGDMSIVGPRPERPEYVVRFAGELDRYYDRHRVKSGITGWSQVNGLRGKTSIAKRVDWDNYYIENWSLWLDLKILVLTVAAVFGPAE